MDKWLTVLVSFGLLATLGGLGSACGSSVNSEVPTTPDSTTLDAPTNVTVTAASRSLTVTFDPVVNAESYNIYIASEPGISQGNWGDLTDGAFHTTDSSPFTITGLRNEVTYYLVVVAMRDTYRSPDSFEVNGRPRGSYVALASGAGFQILDVSDPSNLELLSELSLSGGLTDVSVRGDYAYVSAAGDGLHIVDIHDLRAPELVSTIDTPDNAYGVTSIGDYAVVCDSQTGAVFVNVADPAQPAIEGTYDNPGLAVRADANDSYVFLGAHADGLIVLTPGASPAMQGSWQAPTDSAYGVKIVGDTAFVAYTTEGLRILDVSNPASPSSLGSYDTDDVVWGVGVEGSYAAIADGETGTHILFVDDLTDPTLVSTLPTDGLDFDVEVHDGLVVIADIYNGVKVVDIADPGVIAGDWPNGGTWGIDVVAP